MGVIKELLLLPVAPVRLTAWVSERIAEDVDRSTYGQSAGVEQLDQIEEARASGELGGRQAEALEEEVLEQQLTRAGGQAATRKGDSGD